MPEGRAGQPLKSIIMTHQIRTISKQRLGRLIGYLDDIQLRDEIHSALKEHLDIE
ncbi:MAG TPA: hypothetical protein DCX22_00725 [Dehalococcoidia bacterium]|nr:hypothetical protein [Dehalococcoidia bacterium]